jgi:hypothetical protein
VPKAIDQGSAAKVYFFEERIVRLTQADFEKCRADYSNIPDMRAEAATIDAKFVDDGVDPTNGGVNLCSAKSIASVSNIPSASIDLRAIPSRY